MTSNLDSNTEDTGWSDRSDQEQEYLNLEISLMTAVKAAKAKARRLQRGLMRNGWGCRGKDIYWPWSKTPRIKLYRAFDVAESAALRCRLDVRLRPWTIMVELAQDLANEQGYVACGLLLLGSLLAHGPRAQRPPRLSKIHEGIHHIADKLNRGDYLVIKGETRKRTSMYADQLVNILDNRRSILWNNPREWLENLNKNERFEIRARRFVVFIVLIGAVVFIESLDRPPEISSEIILEFFSWRREVEPPPGTDQILTRAQIRYCVFEAERLAIVRDKFLDPFVISAVNAAVDDYNSRCGSYQCKADNLAAIKKEATAGTERLRTEAEKKATLWRAKSMGIPIEDASADSLVAAGVKLLDPAKPVETKIIQQRLSQLGYYNLSVDGLWGPGSRAALRAFKHDQGMGTSTTWDRATQRRLFYSIQ